MQPSAETAFGVRMHVNVLMARAGGGGSHGRDCGRQRQRPDCRGAAAQVRRPPCCGACGALGCVDAAFAIPHSLKDLAGPVAPSANCPLSLHRAASFASHPSTAVRCQAHSTMRRDLLAAKTGFREALVSVGGLPLLVSMMKDTERPSTLSVAQCLACIASTPSCRPALRRVRRCKSTCRKTMCPATVDGSRHQLAQPPPEVYHMPWCLTMPTSLPVARADNAHVLARAHGPATISNSYVCEHSPTPLLTLP